MELYMGTLLYLKVRAVASFPSGGCCLVRDSWTWYPPAVSCEGGSAAAARGQPLPDSESRQMRSACWPSCLIRHPRASLVPQPEQTRACIDMVASRAVNVADIADRSITWNAGVLDSFLGLASASHLRGSAV